MNIRKIKNKIESKYSKLAKKIERIAICPECGSKYDAMYLEAHCKSDKHKRFVSKYGY